MILSFTSSKGGVGKSTACAAIACALASRGEAVEILDLDPNETLARWHQRAPREGVRVTHVKPDAFSEAFEAVAAQKPRHILIDLAGFLHADILRAFARADLVIIPAGTSEPDLREAMKLSKHIRALSATLEREIPFRILMTRVHSLRSNVGDYIFEQIENAGLPMIKRAMVERVAYKALFVSGEAPTDSPAPMGAGAEVRAILEEIEAITTTRAAQIRRMGAA
mgnify:CR=1 FL=1